ncbi:MAG TPA: hypothetical protein PKY01_03530 [Candidatus Hydrogenedentes bacterium]|nr:hypothetical protein [Candidatus Hydrogenedentota bacterium]HQH51466.1 hypothetical protein [Candidatus Hydrogenedentota bacterium]HQM47948.1 hypothetical protein [Candidatus Hydrogenedentota bacterium]
MSGPVRLLPGEREDLHPRPTYAIPITLLVCGLGLSGMEYYSIVHDGLIEVTCLFIIPGALLLGVIGIIDPRVPSSILPNSYGYPLHLKVIANGCWVISLLAGGVLYYFFVA